jgi:hypothetical protein
MPVVINEFEAVAESQHPQSGGGAASPPPARLDPQTLRLPLRRLAQRHQRLKAH